MDLSTFAGQSITIFFIAEWCVYTVDWIYALIDIDCPTNTTNPQPICAATFPQTLCAPAGLNASLQWFDQSNNAVGAGSCIQVNSPGNYSLKITPNYLVCNAQSNIIINYEVRQTPSAQFVVNDSCIYNEFTTTNTSVNATTFEWTYANSSTESMNYVGNYNSDFNSIQLIAFENGCSDTLVKPISPYFVPTALFEIPETGICTNHLIEISNTSFDASDENLNFVWDFVGGNSSSVTNPIILLPSTGSLTAILVATNTFGCSDTFQMEIQINQVTEANFEFLNECLYNNYQFENTTNSSTSFNAHWEFGDGMNSTELSPTHSYLTNQTFQVELIIENQQGCRDTISKIATPFFVPLAQFTNDPVCLYKNQEFINSSEIADNSTMTYQWELGTGINYFTENTSHLFNQNSPTLIELIAISNNGCKDTIQQMFTPLNTPIAHFNFSNQCVGNLYEFHNYSVSPDDSKLKFEWDFGNGFASTDNNPTHFYQSLGDYEVSLIVMSEDLCSDTLKLIASPFSLPVAKFTMSKTILNEFDSTVDFIDVTEDEIINWNWDLGDNTTANTNQLSHTYYQVADYIVSLIVMNVNGCIDTVDQVISLQPSIYIYVPNTFTPNNDEFNQYFQPQISGEGINYETLMVSIFNRWGDLIWESSARNAFWDGTYKGGDCQTGTYTWKISFFDTINKERENLVGHVNLLR
jgi:gliding motility-associated-like protein